MPPTLVALKSRPYLEDGALGEPRTMQYGHIVTLLDGTSNYRAVNLDLSLSPFRVECAALPPISTGLRCVGKERRTSSIIDFLDQFYADKDIMADVVTPGDEENSENEEMSFSELLLRMRQAAGYDKKERWRRNWKLIAANKRKGLSSEDS